MCNCPAHFALVNCTCVCDHTADRLRQWKERALAAEAALTEVETSEPVAIPVTEAAPPPAGQCQGGRYCDCGAT